MFLYSWVTYSLYFIHQHDGLVRVIVTMSASSISSPFRWRKEWSSCASSFTLQGAQMSSDWHKKNLKAEYCIHRSGTIVIVQISMSHDEQSAPVCSLTSYNKMAILPWGFTQNLLIFLVKCNVHIFLRTAEFSQEVQSQAAADKRRDCSHFWKLQLHLNSRTRTAAED